MLSYERIHAETQSSASAQLNSYLSAWSQRPADVRSGLPSAEEFQQLLKKYLDDYHRFLAINYFSRSQGEKFWSYHRGRLKELGYPLKGTSWVKPPW